MTTAVTIAPSPILAFLDNNGRPCVGGSVLTQVGGVNTATYQDAAGTIPLPNPIPLNNRGEISNASGVSCQLFLATGVTYVFTLLDAYGNQLNQASYVTAPNVVLTSALALPNGAGDVGYIQSMAGAVATTLLERNQREVSIFDWFTAAQIADAKTGAPTLDTTTALQSAINGAAAAGADLIWEGTVLCGQLTATAANIRWRGRRGARVLLTPATYGSNLWHASFSGANPFVRDIVFDGNQSNMTSSQVCNGLLIMATATSPDFDGVTAHQYNGVGHCNYSINGGYVTANLKRGTFRNCHFDDNAGLGMQTIAACYHDYTDCTTDRNGFGWQGVRANYGDTSHSFAAFGVALRMRSHHLTFTNHSSRDNGKDGFDINQGSYAIKVLALLAYGNDDGGVTIAADNTGSGLPGEGESPYDIEIIEIESYNNYTSGVVAYVPVHNLRVTGRIYNNHRLAGDKATAASFRNGVYAAAGSTGLNINVEAYDDRQFCPITAVGTPGATVTLTATGWVAGAMLYYPKVAIYSAGMGFVGYGKITAEAAGSVTIQATAYNGATLTSITSGMYVTQAVQHCGVFADNNCQGSIGVDGYGHRPSAISDGGRNIQSGANVGGQNILILNEKLEDTELLVNPTWDTSVATGWTYNLVGGGSDAAETVVCRSVQGLSLVAGASAVQGDASTISGALNQMMGEFVEFSVWAYAANRGQANIYLFWNPGAGTIATTVTHPGGGWKLMKIGAQIPAGATSAFPRVESVAGATVKWDTASLKVVRSHIDGREYAPISRYLPV